MALADISYGYSQDWSFYCQGAAGIVDQGLQNHSGDDPQNSQRHVGATCSLSAGRLGRDGRIFLWAGIFGQARMKGRKKALVIVAVATWMGRLGQEKPGLAHAFVPNGATVDTTGGLLRRLSVPEDEIAPLITQMRTDGWRSYQVAAKELGMVHHRAILRDPKDPMKLLPWTHRLIANAKAVISSPHREVSEKHL